MIAEAFVAAIAAWIGAVLGARTGLAQYRGERAFSVRADWYRDVSKALSEATRLWESVTRQIEELEEQEDPLPPALAREYSDLETAVERFNETTRDAPLYSSIQTLRELKKLDNSHAAADRDLAETGAALRAARVALVQEARLHMGLDWIGRHEIEKFWHTPDTAR